MIKNKLGFYVL